MLEKILEQKRIDFNNQYLKIHLEKVKGYPVKIQLTQMKRKMDMMKMKNNNISKLNVSGKCNMMMNQIIEYEQFMNFLEFLKTSKFYIYKIVNTEKKSN